MRLTGLIIGALTAASVVATPMTDSTPTVKKRKSKFQFTGVNESGAEFGNTAIPGQLGKDYTWPVNSTIDVGPLERRSKGSNANQREDDGWQGHEHLPDSSDDVRSYPGCFYV
jgi:hypothetical protein